MEPMFRRACCNHFQARRITSLKTKTAGSFDTSVPFYQITRRQVRQNRDVNFPEDGRQTALMKKEKEGEEWDEEAALRAWLRSECSQ